MVRIGFIIMWNIICKYKQYGRISFDFVVYFMYFCLIGTKDMRYRILITMIISFVCTAFINIADKIHVSDNEIQACLVNALENHVDEISTVDFDIFTSGETNYSTTNSNTRNFTKRQSVQRLPDRYIFQTNGKAYDKSFITTYRNVFYHSHIGLLVPYHTHISLGVLII